MLTGTAWAQAAGGAPPAPILQIVPLLLIFVVFYFLLIRPQQQKAKEHKELLDNLKRNDEVVTAGGIFGRIMELSEKVVTVEIAPNVRVRVERSQISHLVSDPKKAIDAKDKEKEKSK